MFARRYQVQERLTAEIADAVESVLTPKGVIVYAEATHLCMAMRGVQKTASMTTTTSTRGCFTSNIHLRSEFLASIEKMTLRN
jgi:GTP cyclohydrolase I